MLTKHAEVTKALIQQLLHNSQTDVQVVVHQDDANAGNPRDALRELFG